MDDNFHLSGSHFYLSLTTGLVVRASLEHDVVKHSCEDTIHIIIKALTNYGN